MKGETFQLGMSTSVPCTCLYTPNSPAPLGRRWRSISQLQHLAPSKLRGDAVCWQCGCLGAALPTSIISSLIYEPKGKQHVRQVVDLKLPAVTSYSLELVQRAACRCG